MNEIELQRLMKCAKEITSNAEDLQKDIAYCKEELDSLFQVLKEIRVESNRSQIRIV